MDKHFVVRCDIAQIKCEKVCFNLGNVSSLNMYLNTPRATAVTPNDFHYFSFDTMHSTYSGFLNNPSFL